MRWTAAAAVCGLLAACGGAVHHRVPEQPTAAPAPSSLRFVEAPLVIVDDGGGVNVWVRLNRSLRDNEGALGDHAGVDAAIEIAGTTPDVPGLYRDDSHPTCYGQFLYGDVTAGERVDVVLGLGAGERVSATVQAQSSSSPMIDADALRRLRCPSDGGATHRCRGSVQGRYAELDVRSVTHTSCDTARGVVRSVGRWADAGRCYRTLCARRHRSNRGFRCSAELVGEAAWQVTCVRGRQIVRAFTAD
jgi:hypothetical protein